MYMYTVYMHFAQILLFTKQLTKHLINKLLMHWTDRNVKKNNLSQNFNNTMPQDILAPKIEP